jgi:hypothetical protein
MLLDWNITDKPNKYNNNKNNRSSCQETSYLLKSENGGQKFKRYNTY